MRTSVFIELTEENAFCRSKPEVFPSQRLLLAFTDPLTASLWLQHIGIQFIATFI